MGTPNFLGTLAWPGQSGVNQPPQMPQQGPPAPQQGNIRGAPSWGNPGGFSNPGGAYEVQRNQGLANIENSQLRNQLIPQFAQQLFGMAGPASQYYQQLMNLGSPYYQQQQRASWEQGTQQANSQAGQARQGLAAQGYGYTPSGSEAAMMGGMGQAAAGNLTNQFLQNLFQNEQMQLQGAGGLSQLASLFQPAGLFGGSPANISIPSSFFQNLSSTMQSIFGNRGVGSVLPGSYTGQGQG